MHAGGTRRATSWTHGSWAVHEPPLRSGQARRSMCLDARWWHASRDILDARVVGGSRTAPTVRPGTPQHTPGMHAGDTRRARHPGRTGRGRFTNRPYGQARYTMAYAGNARRRHASRGILDARVVDGSRTAPTGRPAPIPLASPAPCCTITPVAFTDPLHSLTYCYA